MAQTLYPLQLIEFKDNKGKAQGYGQALQGRYSNWGFGNSIAMSCGIGTVGFTIGGLVAMFASISPLSALVVEAVFFISFFIGFASFLEWGRKSGIRRLLQDPEAKYHYMLKQAVDAYNKQADAFNKRLLAGEENMRQAYLERLKDLRNLLDEERKGLQKRIGPNLCQEILPDLDMRDIWKNMHLLRQAESQLALTSHGKPALLEESPEYKEALAELEAEFPG